MERIQKKKNSIETGNDNICRNLFKHHIEE